MGGKAHSRWPEEMLQRHPQTLSEKVKVGNDQDRRNQKKIPTPKTEVGKKLNEQSGTHIMETYRKPNEQLFSQ